MPSFSFPSIGGSQAACWVGLAPKFCKYIPRPIPRPLDSVGLEVSLILEASILTLVSGLSISKSAKTRTLLEASSLQPGCLFVDLNLPYYSKSVDLQISSSPKSKCARNQMAGMWTGSKYEKDGVPTWAWPTDLCWKGWEGGQVQRQACGRKDSWQDWLRSAGCVLSHRPDWQGWGGSLLLAEQLVKELCSLTELCRSIRGMLSILRLLLQGQGKRKSNHFSGMEIGGEEEVS